MNYFSNSYIKGLFSAGLLATYLAAGSQNSIYAQQRTEQSGVQVPAKENKVGLVISSNKDIRIATLSLDMLIQNPEFEKSYIQEVSQGDDKFYRVLVAMPNDRWADIYRRKLKSLNRFNDLDSSFVIDLNPEDLVRPIVSDQRTSTEANTKSIKPVKKEKPRTTYSNNSAGSRNQSAPNNSNSNPDERIRYLSRSVLYSQINNLGRNDFIETFSPELMKRYKSFYKEDLPETVAKRRLGNIYDYSREVNLSPVFTLSVVFKESNGSGHVVGDQDLGSEETAHGMLQIRKPTIDTVISMMRARGFRNVPANRDAVLLNEEAITRLGVVHLGFCYEKNKNFALAARCHNAGLNSAGKNINRYVETVDAYAGTLTNIAKKAQQNQQ